MTSHDTPTDRTDFEDDNERIIQFRDGEVCLGYDTPGATVTLGSGSEQKHARLFFAENMAWVVTEDGQRVALANGLVLTYEDPDQDPTSFRELMPLDDDLGLVVGEPLIFHDFQTAPVKSLLLRYRWDLPDSSIAEVQVNRKSPFTRLEEQTARILGY